ncbi:hypothetical protein [Sporanaerobacter sp. PP17-6a]|uniref:hypothetical protein n=1 Tax=Sporanaerobacter sp. PP17-6a TaxID=1891289 RepID=UPI0008A078FB|nr:hypothetical protein [Sporanaerobacter sp. PP17-6a]SCL84986.1 hypothetical protein PP176A_0770 [Sporanaerobacter sp. PP17-6a]
MDTIKLLILNSDGLAFVIAIITIIFTYYLSRHTSSQEIIKEQHEKLISPIFFILEPYLFQSINNECLEKVFHLIGKNKSLVDGKLLEIAYFCNENPSQANYNALCAYINKSYDKSCKRLGLRTRSIEYRLNRKQYETKLSLFIYICFLTVKGLLVLGMALLIFLSLLLLGCYFFSRVKTPENEPVLLLIVSIMFLGLIKYFDI